MSRKSVLLLFLPLIALLCLPGCPKKQSASPDEVVLFVRASATEVETWQKAVDAYTEATKVSVSLQTEPPATYHARLQSLIARGAAPDVAVVDSTSLPQLVSTGQLQSLNTLIQSQTDVSLSGYYPSAMHAFQYQGGTYGLPYDVSVLAVAYNVDLFELAYLQMPAPDWNWQDYLKYARALTRDTDDNGTVDAWGTAIPQWWQVNVWGNGGDVVDDASNPQRSTLSSPATQQALQYLADLTLKEKVAPPVNKPAGAQPLNAFCAGHIGMILATHADIPQMQKARDLRFGVLPLPRGKNAANLGLTSAFCLPKGSKHEQEAWKLMAYLAGQDGQALLLEGGFTTPALEAMANSEYFTAVGSTAKNPYLGAPKMARPLPFTPHYAQIAAIWDEELKALWTGQATVQQVTQRIDERVNQVLQQPQR